MDGGGDLTATIAAQGARLLAALSLALLSACEQVRAPPPLLMFDGLPIAGGPADARRAGFTACVNLDAVHIRCRRDGVIVANTGPFVAAVDLDGSSGAGGFDQLTLWHDTDNDAVFKLAAALEQSGWRKCFTGNGRAGDQAIYTRNGSPVWMSMDISYWSKRRLRIIPDSEQRGHRCAPA